jgi:hypothetical protein
MILSLIILYIQLLFMYFENTIILAKFNWILAKLYYKCQQFIFIIENIKNCIILIIIYCICLRNSYIIYVKVEYQIG